MPTLPITSLGLLKSIDDFDSFIEVRNIAPDSISTSVIKTVQQLDEKEELEPYLRLILHDPNAPPHGPAEIADIFTHKLSINKLVGMAAFILKGRSFRTVKPKDVAHQIYRLKKIAGLAIAIFAAPGIILDGEIVVLRQGKPDFRLLLSRNQTRAPLKIRSLARTFPATYVVSICFTTGSNCC